MSRTARYASEADADLLRYELSSGNNRIAKRGLQRLCELYEARKRLRDPSIHRRLIHSHLTSDQVLLRRWSFKALGLIGNVDDVYRIVAQLKVEGDHETCSWGVAALIRTAGDDDLGIICRNAGQSLDKSLTLAARLYAPESWIGRNWRPVTVSLHDDDLALKWAVFLVGYGKAAADMFHPAHGNGVFLGELNRHGNAEVCEYSAWGLWQRADLGATHATVPLDAIAACPTNARKWLYRLYMRSPDEHGLDADAFGALRKAEVTGAREGLALGVADLTTNVYDDAVLDWFEEEKDPAVTETLLMGMAKHGARNPDFSCQVRASFKRMAPESAGRARLLAAAGGTSLFSELKALEHLQTAGVQGELLQHGITINNYGNQTLSSGIQAGTINAQNVAGNDVSVENNQANQQFAPDPSAQAELIGRIIEFARSGALPPGPAHEVIERAEAAAAAPTPERRTALLDTLKGVAEGVAAAGSAGTALAGLVAAASNLF